jgi:hypothetical protein
MHLRHGFELAQIACRESRISEYPRASVGARHLVIAPHYPFFLSSGVVATEFGKTPGTPRFFGLMTSMSSQVSGMTPKVRSTAS